MDSKSLADVVQSISDPRGSEWFRALMEQMEKFQIHINDLQEQVDFLKDELEEAADQASKLTTRVAILENELGAVQAKADQPAAVKRSPPRKAPPKTSTKSKVKKSSFEDDGKLYFVGDYTEKSYAIFGKSAYTLIEPVTKGFRMLYTEKMLFGPGATGPRAGGAPFLAAVHAEIAKRNLKLEVVETTRAKMSEQFAILEGH